ncbi:uncharacterized protein LOC116603460 [Nematostella vectensis]|uniref:uncharacterized protein LOC116603460 n=1 Tax=Nematostella vectensis TaxID=45351 RepID=UPI00139016BC|nr:uncharacterized protein LOC116603460 [Nematostella vectensis]
MAASKIVVKHEFLHVYAEILDLQSSRAIKKRKHDQSGHPNMGSTLHIEDDHIGILIKSLTCQDDNSRFDTAYTTMLTDCEDLKFCVLGGVPAKDMYYLYQNVINLNEIC